MSQDNYDRLEREILDCLSCGDEKEMASKLLNLIRSVIVWENGRCQEIASRRMNGAHFYGNEDEPITDNPAGDIYDAIAIRRNKFVEEWRKK